jgi:hypothetical protein
MEYKIEVLMTPHPHDSPNKPYFWRVIRCDGYHWCTECFNWEETQDSAFNAAKEYYNTHCKEN